MSLNDFPYPIGSEWRKWDLHVHTKLDSSYSFHSDPSISGREQNDEEYPKVFIEHLYSVENLGAIAITDHNKGDWIDKLIDENNKYTSSNGKNKITILPGVEIESGDGIHLLVIFNPDTQLEDVKRNFRKLTWKETIEHFITANKNPSNPNTFKTTEEIMEEAKKWDAVCIFAHVTSDKGFFRISSGDRKTKIYKHNLTQIFQIPREGITDEGILRIINGEDPNYWNKSITKITASDAKRLTDIGTNNCWIKADPTFEGLKQIIYEPEERVYIGEEPPRKIERNKVIESIMVFNSNKWFEDNKPILLNEDLVSIIGGKGTGKTALLDLIAYAARSYKCYEMDEMKSKSFLKKAFKKLKGTKIKLEWGDGNPDEIIIGDKLEETVEEGKVRYLPQDFTDQLCSEIGKGELEKQIEKVIFQKLPPEDRSGFNDFQAYKETQLKIVNDKKNRVAEQIKETNSIIYDHRKLISLEKKKKEEKEKVESEIKDLKREMERILESLKDFKAQREILDTLNSKNKEKSQIEDEISKLKNKLLKIDEIINKITTYIEDANTFVERLKNDLSEVEIGKKDIEKIKIVLYPENLRQILDRQKEEVDIDIKKRKKGLDKINQEIKELNDRISVEKSKQEKIREINNSLSDLEKRAGALNHDIERIKKAKNEIDWWEDKREKLFIDYFELIFEEKEKLKEIYSPLRNMLEQSEEENEKLFDFAVKFNFDIDGMAAEGHELIDLRADGKFRQSKPEVLREELEKLRFSLDFDKPNISDDEKRAIKEFLKKVRELFTEGEGSISSQLKKQRYTEEDFDNWLFSTKYYSMSYSIKFNDIELNNLSPGLKGVALLILFLELDKDDKRPILIDQPEENLDNRSVYSTLVRYFRNAKKRRQVIIVTHNPNLVVNADSDQVIVANLDKGLKNQSSRIYYVSGSIENTFKNDSAGNILEKQGIREHICEILEGGEEAFRKREDKYQIK